MEMWFAGFSSLMHYCLEMQYCYITTAKQKRHLIDVPAADGDIDAMEGIGEPTYETRTVTALFKMLANAEDTRTRIINDLEGKTVEIVLPNDLNHYMIGRVHIAGVGLKISDKLLVTIECLPWRYARNEVVISVASSQNKIQHEWWNRGHRLVVPEITIEGPDAVFTVNGETIVLGQGTHLSSALAIPGYGKISLAASGGAFIVQYREAIL